MFTPASVSEIKDSGNEYPSDSGGPARENIYEPRQTARHEGRIGEMGEEYGVDFTPEQEKKFVTASTFGVPMRSMQKYLDLPSDQQDKLLKNEGIPCDSTDNQFKSWVRNARQVNPDLRIAIKLMRQLPTL